VEYRVNADITVNVATIVNTQDPPIEDTDEAIRHQAKAQLAAGNFIVGDPVTEPTINFVEPEDIEG